MQIKEAEAVLPLVKVLGQDEVPMRLTPGPCRSAASTARNRAGRW